MFTDTNQNAFGSLCTRLREAYRKTVRLPANEKVMMVLAGPVLEGKIEQALKPHVMRNPDVQSAEFKPGMCVLSTSKKVGVAYKTIAPKVNVLDASTLHHGFEYLATSDQPIKTYSNSNKEHSVNIMSQSNDARSNSASQSSNEHSVPYYQSESEVMKSESLFNNEQAGNVSMTLSNKEQEEGESQTCNVLMDSESSYHKERVETMTDIVKNKSKEGVCETSLLTPDIDPHPHQGGNISLL